MPATHIFRPIALFAAAAALLTSASLSGAGAASAATDAPPVPPSPYASVAAAVKAGFIKQETVDLAVKRGAAPIIVQLVLPTPFTPETTKNSDAQRLAIKNAQDAVVQKLSPFKPDTTGGPMQSGCKALDKFKTNAKPQLTAQLAKT